MKRCPDHSKRTCKRAWSLWWLLLLGAGLLLLGGCRPAPPEPAASRIAFVTATPRPRIVLNEGLRSFPQESPPEPAFFAEANELGQVLVLEYHQVGYPEQRYQRTPANFRADLERLYRLGYYPVNFVELIQGLPDVPPGKKPVVLTFDDSLLSQFRILDDNTIDTDSAVGILLDFHQRHPDDWPSRATFFVLGNDTNEHKALFGQSKWAGAKLQFLVNWGMEIGSHTATHIDLSMATAERIGWELAVSKHVVEELVPGYTVQTLSVPFGGFPYSVELLRQGDWGGFEYRYVGNAAAWGGPTVSPFHQDFEPYRVPRLEVTATSLERWLAYVEEHPDEYYVSDGDPRRLTYPQVEAAARP